MDKTRRDDQDAWERCQGVKQHINRLSLTKKFYLRATQLKMKRNRAAIAAAKLENKQLRNALRALREKERCALGSNDLSRMQQRVAKLQKYLNEQRDLVKAKQQLVKKHANNPQNR